MKILNKTHYTNGQAIKIINEYLTENKTSVVKRYDVVVGTRNEGEYVLMERKEIVGGRR